VTRDEQIMEAVRAVVDTTCPHGPEWPHGCPFRAEIHEDYDWRCTCCHDCEQNCCDDI